MKNEVELVFGGRGYLGLKTEKLLKNPENHGFLLKFVLKWPWNDDLVFFVGVGVGLGLPKIENFLKNSKSEVESRKFCVKSMVNIVEREKWSKVSVWG